MKKPLFPKNAGNVEFLLHDSRQRRWRVPESLRTDAKYEKADHGIHELKRTRVSYSNKTVAPTVAAITQYPPYCIANLAAPEISLALLGSVPPAAVVPFGSVPLMYAAFVPFGYVMNRTMLEFTG